MELRKYQTDIIERIERSKSRNILAQLPTGGGKTVIFCELIRRRNVPSIVLAHRRELISQASVTLANQQIPHGIIAPDKLIREIVRIHMDLFGRAWYSTTSPVLVGSVDSLRNRTLGRIRLVIVDEAHHVLPTNKWGAALEQLTGADMVLGVTATPERTDGKGLDGVFEELILGPTPEELITQGYLTPYRVFSTPADIDLGAVPIGSTGDFSKKPLVAEVRKSKIVGDVVAHYLRLAPGKQGVTFATDVETAYDITERFKAAGVPAELVTAKTPDRERFNIIRQFRAGRLRQLVNVDLFGEGFDLPAIEVVSMARPTASFILYMQQFGRALRPREGKPHAIIIDHVGNWKRHGLPDFPHTYSLEGKQKTTGGAKTEGEIALRTCLECTGVYPRYLRTCPLCGAVHTPGPRSTPAQVDGDLVELSPEYIQQVRAEIARVDAPEDDVLQRMLWGGAPREAAYGAAKQHKLRQAAQGDLRAAISSWAGCQSGDVREIQRKFYLRFGTDVLTAQTLGRPQAAKLTEEIENDIRGMGYAVGN